MFTLTRLSGEQLVPYADLTFPSLREQLLDANKKAAVVAIGAAWFGKPVGLAWGMYWAEHASGLIKTIFVMGKYRRSGIGTAMLREMEAALQQLGCKDMRFGYRYDPERSSMWERFFRKSDWGQDRDPLHKFTASIDRFLEMEWVRRHRLPAGFSFFSWGDLQEEERAAIAAGEAVWYPAAMSPLYGGRRTNPNLSVGLRNGADIVGWMIIHEYDEETVIGDRMYIRPPYQAQGRAVAAMIEAVRRIADANVPFARFDVADTNKPMLRFVERKMKPCLVDSYKMVRLGKRMVAAGI